MNSPEPAKKKTVKKVVKRTVSVKRTRMPVSSTDLEQGPPNDGCDYVKVCGKWVRMKSSSTTRPPANLMEMDTTSGANSDGSASIPLSRSEWGENISVGK